jgi:hypothetical protein
MAENWNLKIKGDFPIRSTEEGEGRYKDSEGGHFEQKDYKEFFYPTFLI